MKKTMTIHGTLFALAGIGIALQAWARTFDKLNEKKPIHSSAETAFLVVVAVLIVAVASLAGRSGLKAAVIFISLSVLVWKLGSALGAATLGELLKPAEVSEFLELKVYAWMVIVLAVVYELALSCLPGDGDAGTGEQHEHRL